MLEQVPQVTGFEATQAAAWTQLVVLRLLPHSLSGQGAMTCCVGKTLPFLCVLYVVATALLTVQDRGHVPQLTCKVYVSPSSFGVFDLVLLTFKLLPLLAHGFRLICLLHRCSQQ